MTDLSNGLCVFAYGSLLWKPGFNAIDTKACTLRGYRRGFFLWSIHYRGTEQLPGLVLGLDEEAGASTRGLALFVGADEAAETLEYLRERELVSYAYREAWVPLFLDDGSEVVGVTYVMDHDHPQYCAPLAPEAQAEIIAVAQGTTGTNADYLYETNRRLEALDQSDAELKHLETIVRKLR